MALERPPGAIEFMFRIKVQHYSGNFTPVSNLHVRVEQAQIRDEVLLVVHSQHTGSEGAVSETSGSSGGFCMAVLATGC
jgi:hypothetical protein